MEIDPGGRPKAGYVATILFCSLLTGACLIATWIYVQDPLAPRTGLLNRSSLFFGWLISLWSWKLAKRDDGW